MNDHCYVIPIEKSISPEEQETTSAISLTVKGMGCPNCAMRVHNGLLSLKGVIQAEVNHVTASANVVFNPNLLTIIDLAEAVANAGNDGRHRYQVVSPCM
ncbi:MAG: heavy-metal-associated domain-containing protein [Anaerolineae bacterium]|nr:heavy-metal-associated domain-containing protein [Anaerolineae bacterium]